MEVLTGIEIWRSQLYLPYKRQAKYLVGLGIYIAFIPLIVFLVFHSVNVKLEVLMPYIITLIIIMGIISPILIWIGTQFLITYLIIYENGIKIRKPYRFFSQKFILYSDIDEIQIIELPWYYGTWSLIRGSISHYLQVFIELNIILKNRKIFSTSSSWVDDIEWVKQFFQDNKLIQKIKTFNLEQVEVELPNPEKLRIITKLFDKIIGLSTRNTRINSILPKVEKLAKNAIENLETPNDFRLDLIDLFERHFIPRHFKKIMRLVFEKPQIKI